jgi:hypothetical protein
MASGTVLTMNPAIAAGMHTRPQAATISSGGSGGGMMVDNRPYAPSVALSRPPATSRFTISAAPGSNLAALFSLGTLDTSKLQHLEFFHLTHLPELISAQVDAGQSQRNTCLHILLFSRSVRC